MTGRELLKANGIEYRRNMELTNLAVFILDNNIVPLNVFMEANNMDWIFPFDSVCPPADEDSEDEAWEIILGG